MLSAALSFALASGQPIVVDGMLCHPHRLIVQCSKPIEVGKGDRLLWFDGRIGYAAIEVKGDLRKERQRYLFAPGVSDVRYDRAAKPAYDPNDPIWPDMWHFRNIKANLAWDISKGSPVPVAVIDTGINLAHPDLEGNAWTNAGEIAGNGIDDDGNGYIDDIHGYDFGYNDPDPNDVFGHGTACAGLVGAVQDNALGVTGVAPNARLIALKACNDSGYFYDSMTIPSYMYAASNGARVLSMSYFSDHVSPGERTALEYCVAHGVLPVAASGNSNSALPYYPAAYECVLSVAAQNSDNTRAGFSDYGTWVDVAAPGVSLRTTTSGGGYTYSFGGTSGACPHIAGLATLLFGAKPTATNAEVRAAIEDTAVIVGNYCNYGMADAQAAMTALLGTPAAPKSPKFAYVTPAGYDMSADRADEQNVRVYGRGFQLPNTVAVTVNGQAFPVVAQTRDYVDVATGPVRGSLVLWVNGANVGSATLPATDKTVHSGIEGSTQGAGLSGGFLQMLNDDGSELVCGSRSDGTLRFESAFRRVAPSNSMTLRFTRRYTGAATGLERIYLYDWSSASYPYGNWIQLQSGALPTTATTSTISVPNPNRFLDDESTVYFLITVESGDAGTQLRLDSLNYLRP
ncbi:MAG: S8 family peptidase [Fimbriimonadales bacterium]